MDTPEWSGIGGGTQLSKFEDSPVFNFINNLSPIKPVKSVDSVHISHTYQSLNFASLSSIFSSPHANPQKESRILTRPTFPEFFKNELSSYIVDENSQCTGSTDTIRLSRCTTIVQENCTTSCSVNEASIEPSDEGPILPGNLIQLKQYDAASPNHNTTPCYGIKMDLSLDEGHAPVELVHFVQNGLEKRKVLFSSETCSQENYPLIQHKDEAAECDWENLISYDVESLLIFDTSTKSEACLGEIGNNEANPNYSLFSTSTENADNLQKTQPNYVDGNVIQDPYLNCNEEFGKEDGGDNTPKMPSGTCQNQIESHQQRGIRRRCLVFEASGASKKHLYSVQNLNPSKSISSKCKSVSDDKNLKPPISPLPCALPGIGLHLNTLATTSKEREALASGKQLINVAHSINSFLPTPAGRKSLNKPLDVEKDLHSINNEAEDLMHDESSLDAAPGDCEELSQGSPKKKRRRSENDGESDGCKRCNCKKSKCLKLYCECFAAGVYCSEPCSCQGCFNKPIHEETVLATRKQIESRNPLAFAPKVIRSSEGGQEMADDDNKTPASARHKRGCNCKKSSCLKKYCECYQGGVGCSVSCRCEGCKNAFGRKEGTIKVGAEDIEQGEDKSDACEMETGRLSDDQQIAHTQIDDHPSSEDLVPSTPSLQGCRLSVELPMFSSARPPRSSKFSIGCSPGLYGTHMLLKSEILLPEHKYDKNVSSILEDDTPAFLASPGNGVKIASPNSKRVSPPHNGAGLTPNRKGGRKLILKSIPSFPSLNNDVSTENPLSHSHSSCTSSAFN